MRRAVTAAPEHPPGSRSCLENAVRAIQSLCSPKKNLPSSILTLPQPFCTVSDTPVCYSLLFKWVVKPIFFENPLFKVGENIRQSCGLPARQRRLRTDV